MCRITNLTGGLLVCPLRAESNTLRLNNKETKDIPDEDMTDYLYAIEKKGLIKCVKVEEKRAIVKSGDNEKEE